MNMLQVSRRSAQIRAFERTNIHGHTMRSSKNFREKRVLMEKKTFSCTFLNLTFLNTKVSHFANYYQKVKTIIFRQCVIQFCISLLDFDLKNNSKVHALLTSPQMLLGLSYLEIQNIIISTIEEYTGKRKLFKLFMDAKQNYLKFYFYMEFHLKKYGISLQ